MNCDELIFALVLGYMFVFLVLIIVGILIKMEFSYFRKKDQNKIRELESFVDMVEEFSGDFMLMEEIKALRKRLGESDERF
ncbi:MAG: hypothetical protein GXO75_08415 [Calditrichaeota bacterium]|nr:hypothetical protein [Calditrichota bacterium]